MAAKKSALAPDPINLNTPAVAGPVKIAKLCIKQASIRLVGDSPLIVHRWSEKARQMILDKQTKASKQPKGAKNPQEDYEQSLYRMPDGGYGFPAGGFKSAAVDACSHLEGITKVEARGAFHIIGDMVRIEGEPTMREDMVRLNGMTADVRHRGEFKQWACEIRLRYNSNVLSAEQILTLFNTAGFAIGVGEWRPEKNGSFGMFHCE